MTNEFSLIQLRTFGIFKRMLSFFLKLYVLSQMLTGVIRFFLRYDFTLRKRLSTGLLP